MAERNRDRTIAGTSVIGILANVFLAAFKAVIGLTANPYVPEMHGFYLDKAEKTMRFDVVVSFHAKDRRAVYQKICEDVQKAYPDYALTVAPDTDFAE